MTRSEKRERPATYDHSAVGDGESDASLVPSRRQYLELKRQHPDALLLYRLGDFYETFDDDAVIAARDARITLTSRSFGRNGRVPMAGIPHHALNHYLQRLLTAGHTVAIADQISEPGRGLVERAVTRVLTPGTIADAALLPASENRYLAAAVSLGDRLGLAWVDVSTGEFATLEIQGQQARGALGEELARLSPAECLVPMGEQDDLPTVGHRTRLEPWHFAPGRATDLLCRHFGVRSLAAFGCDDRPAAIGAAGAVLAYVQRTNPSLAGLLTGLRTESIEHHVSLDGSTRRNLELTRSIKTGGRRGSLLAVLDETRTSMGGRALRRMVGQPLRDLTEIEHRQRVIGALIDRPHARAALSSSLDEIGDLERLVSRVCRGDATIRDLLTLSGALHALLTVVSTLRSGEDASLIGLAELIDSCRDVRELIESAVAEDEDGVARIRGGYSPALDTALDECRETRRWLASLERRERERTGIRSLKVGYTKVFGYFLEVTRSNLHLVPDDYVRKQTVANGERYFTAALKEAEARILASDMTIAALEREALARLCESVAGAATRLRSAAEWLAYLDALLSLANVAERSRWVRPHLDEGDSLEIVDGRHPVVEAQLDGEAFIPNDCQLGAASPRLLLVTGPNMGGKSTYLRQVALIALLAQIGSYVPARAARIGIVDRIFTRVGAQDDLSGGASTFMVEMTETAAILHQATRRSLVILDEVGRGTSTADGLAIARAVVEDLHHRVGARTLFATHFLDLTTLAQQFEEVDNVHVAAMEVDGRVIFLYGVRPGAADRAYGIQVARLAGLPDWVADRASELMFDADALGSTCNEPQKVRPPCETSTRQPIAEAAPAYQLTLDGSALPLDDAHRLSRELLALELGHLSPRQALDWLYEQQQRLRVARGGDQSR